MENKNSSVSFHFASTLQLGSKQGFLFCKCKIVLIRDTTVALIKKYVIRNTMITHLLKISDNYSWIISCKQIFPNTSYVWRNIHFITVIMSQNKCICEHWLKFFSESKKDRLLSRQCNKTPTPSCGKLQMSQLVVFVFKTATPIVLVKVQKPQLIVVVFFGQIWTIFSISRIEVNCYFSIWPFLFGKKKQNIKNAMELIIVS